MSVKFLNYAIVSGYFGHSYMVRHAVLMAQSMVHFQLFVSIQVHCVHVISKKNFRDIRTTSVYGRSPFLIFVRRDSLETEPENYFYEWTVEKQIIYNGRSFVYCHSSRDTHQVTGHVTYLDLPCDSIPARNCNGD